MNVLIANMWCYSTDKLSEENGHGLNMAHGHTVCEPSQHSVHVISKQTLSRLSVILFSISTKWTNIRYIFNNELSVW